MKKSLQTFLLLIVSIIIVSCTSAKQELRDEVKRANAQCPINAGIIGNISSIVYNEADNEVAITLMLSDCMPGKLSALSGLKDIIKKAALSNETDALKELLTPLADAGAKLKYVYISPKSGESFELELTEKDVQDIVAGKTEKLSAYDYLKINETSTNAQCPWMVDEATTMVSVKVSGNQFVYNYIINEDIITLQQLIDNKQNFRYNILHSLTSQDPSLASLVKASKEGNVNIVYHYTGNKSGQELTLTISPSEL